MTTNQETTTTPADAPEIHPAHQEILQFFAYEHLPEALQGISKPFGDLANTMARTCKNSREASVALRKLLEAKDAAVRACL